MRGFNATTKANPIGLLIGILIAAGTALYMFSKKLDSVTGAQKELNDLSLKVKKSIVEERVEMEQLLRVANDEKRSKDDRIAAIKKLNEISPEYLGNLSLEKINTDEAKRATDNYIKSLEKEARLKAAKERLVEIEKELIDLRQEGKGAELEWTDELWNTVKSGGNALRASTLNAQTAMENYHQKENELLGRKKALLGELDRGNSDSSKSSPKIGTRKTVGNEVLEWDGKQWNVVQTLEPNLDNQEKSYQDELKLLTENLEKGLMTQIEYEAQRDYLELAHLESRLAEKQKAGKDTLALEKQIADKRLAIQKGINDAIAEIENELDSEEDTELEDPSKFAERMSAEAKARLEASQRECEAKAQADLLEAETDEEQYQAKIELEAIRFEEELERIGDQDEQRRLAELNHKAEVDKIDQDYDNKKLGRIKNGLKIANNLLSAGAGFFEAQKQKELAAAGDNAEKREAIEKKYAEKQKKVAIAQALIAGALGVIQIWATPSTMPDPWAQIYKIGMTALLAGTTIAQVGTIKSAQFAEGRYPVMGASDGNVYQTQYVPDLKTDVYSQPSIGMFSEVEPEMVVDGATTKRLMFDYPEVYSGILSLSKGGAPQFADGRYPNGSNSSDTSDNTDSEGAAPQIIYQSDPESLAIMKKLGDILEGGIETRFDYSKFKKKSKKFDNFDNKMQMTQSS